MLFKELEGDLKNIWTYIFDCIRTGNWWVKANFLLRFMEMTQLENKIFNTKYQIMKHILTDGIC